MITDNTEKNKLIEYAAKEFNTIEEAEKYLNSIGLISYDIESISFDGKELRYLNFGDTYDLTVCTDGGKLFAASWGDWLEEQEERYEEDNNQYKCCYCGEFHDCDNAPNGWDSDGSYCVYKQ